MSDSEATQRNGDQSVLEKGRQPSDDDSTSSHQNLTTKKGGDAPPDGGLKAWLVVLGSFCVAFCSFGWLNSIGVFQDYYQGGPLSNYSSSTISWIPSLQIFFMFGMGPIVGFIYDKYGPLHLLLVGSFLHVFGLMMASLATEYYQFLLSQGVCSAIGVAAIFQPAINVIPSWFNAKRGAAYGVFAAGSSLGGVIFPIMVSRLIGSVGYPWAMRAAAFLILGLLVVANCTIRSRVPPHPQGMTASKLVAPLREPAFMGVVVGFMLLTFGIFVPIDYIQVEALQAGMRPGLAGYLVPILNAASLFGRVGSGIIGDKIGRFNVFVVSCLSAGALTLALWLPVSTATAASSSTTNSLILAFTVLFGFFSGAYVSLLGALVAATSPPREIGFRTGLMFLAASIPGLVTNPIAGAILARSGGSFLGVKIYAAVFMLAGTAFVAASRVRETGWKLRVVF